MCIHVYIHILMRDERRKEERSKQGHVHVNFSLSPSPPLQACADKLKNEIAQYGFPPVFPKSSEEKAEEEQQANSDPVDPTKRVKKVRLSVDKAVESHYYISRIYCVLHAVLRLRARWRPRVVI